MAYVDAFQGAGRNSREFCRYHLLTCCISGNIQGTTLTVRGLPIPKAAQNRGLTVQCRHECLCSRAFYAGRAP